MCRYFIFVFLFVKAVLGDVNYVYRFAETVGVQNVESLYITSSQPTLALRQQDIAAELPKVLESGIYNVLEIRTFYTDGFLTSAEILNDKDKSGPGNQLRMVLVTADCQFGNIKSMSISEQHRNVLPLIKNLLRVQKIYDCGNLAAIEYYFLLERK